MLRQRRNYVVCTVTYSLKPLGCWSRIPCWPRLVNIHRKWSIAANKPRLEPKRSVFKIVLTDGKAIRCASFSGRTYTTGRGSERPKKEDKQKGDICQLKFCTNRPSIVSVIFRLIASQCIFRCLVALHCIPFKCLVALHCILFRWLIALHCILFRWLTALFCLLFRCKPLIIKTWKS